MNRKGLMYALLIVVVSGAAMMAPGLAQAATVTEYTTGVSQPGTMVNGADGNVWFINGTGIAKTDPSGNVTTYTVGLNSGAAPYDLTNGPNNDLWFTDNGSTKAVGYINASGSIHEFTDPVSGNPLQIITGSDGNLWFYNSGVAHSLVKMTPSGSFTYSILPGGGQIDDNLVLGPDGAIWFSDQGTTSIGKIGPDGIIHEYPIGGSAFPTNITVGADGNLWFSDNFGAIGRVTTSGSIHEFTAGLQTSADPDAITAGPDGNVWFTDQSSTQRAIGRITPSGQITEFTAGLNQDLPLDITAGADGDLYVPQASMGGSTPSAIAEITTSGHIAEITSGVHADGLQDGDSILAGSTGALWFTDSLSPKAIGRIVLPPVAVTGAASAVTSTGATVDGSVTPRADATTVTVEYGTSSQLGSTATIGEPLPGATSPTAVTGMLTGLPPATTIYFRIVATNSGGESEGATESFTTAAPPAPPAQQIIATFGNQHIMVTMAPASVCIARSASLPVKLASLVIAGSKSLKLKFSDAALFLDRGLKHTAKRVERKHGRKVTVRVITYRANLTVRRLPASVALKLNRLTSGAHRLRTAFSYTESIVKHGHRSKKTVIRSLTASFAIC